MKRTALCMALAAMAIGQPVMAATCWNDSATEAVQVKQFDIMLMVSTLRCRGKGMDFSADYNQFVINKRLVLRAMGDEIVRQFNRDMGGKAAFNAYDHLTVVMANKYGNGVDGADCGDIRALIADANSVPASRDSLVGLAQRAGMDPSLPAPRCAAPIVTAAAKPAVAFASPVTVTAEHGAP